MTDTTTYFGSSYGAYAMNQPVGCDFEVWADPVLPATVTERFVKCSVCASDSS